MKNLAEFAPAVTVLRGKLKKDQKVFFVYGFLLVSSFLWLLQFGSVILLMEISP